MNSGWKRRGVEMNLNAVVALPAFNEAERISAVVADCLCQGVAVWVMDDGSSDETVSRAESAGATVFKTERNQGKGMAIRRAMQAFSQSRHEFLILMDSDGQHDPIFIPKFVELAQSTGSGLVLGNRMENSHLMPCVRRWTNGLMSWLICRFIGQDVPDTQCGFRLLNRPFIESFNPTTFRYDLESEMLIQAGRKGFKIESVAISTIYSGQSSHIRPFPDTLRFIRLILKYLFFKS